jgi:hypothetical protein
MDEKEIDLEIRLMAIETVISSILASVIATHPDPNAELARLRTQMIGQARQETLPGAAPEISDHFSGEYELRLCALLDGASSMLKAARSR